LPGRFEDGERRPVMLLLLSDRGWAEQQSLRRGCGSMSATL
jgi:hypothetical protein